MQRLPAPFGDCKDASTFSAEDNAYTELYPVEYTASVSVGFSPVAEGPRNALYHFYRAMLCIRGTSHGPASVLPSVCPSVRHKSVFY